jgi:hypothetical protein
MSCSKLTPASTPAVLATSKVVGSAPGSDLNPPWG